MKAGIHNTSSSAVDKINQVLNPKLLGFSISESEKIKFDKELENEIKDLYNLALKTADKIKKSIPQSSQTSLQNQESETHISTNLEKSIDNLKKNIHLFDPKLEEVRRDLQSEAHQKGLALIMNSLISNGDSKSEESKKKEKQQQKERAANSQVSTCLKILESRWQGQESRQE